MTNMLRTPENVISRTRVNRRIGSLLGDDLVEGQPRSELVFAYGTHQPAPQAPHRVAPLPDRLDQVGGRAVDSPRG